jgi:hypothetical protein
MSIAAASDAAIVKATVIIAFIPVVTVLGRRIENPVTALSDLTIATACIGCNQIAIITGFHTLMNQTVTAASRLAEGGACIAIYLVTIVTILLLIHFTITALGTCITNTAPKAVDQTVAAT